MNKQTRLKVYERYNGHCAYCGKEIEFRDMQVDHIVPKRTLYGIDRQHVDHVENLNPACRRCNHYKRASSLETFRRNLLTLHERIRKQYLDKVAEDYGVITVKEWDGKFYFEQIGGGQ